MQTTDKHNKRIAKISFAEVYSLYLTKIKKKGQTKQELDSVIKWLTGFDDAKIQQMIKQSVNFEEFFAEAKLNKNAHLITGVICGYRIEDIKNPLTKKVRYLDKLVDELARGKRLDLSLG